MHKSQKMTQKNKIRPQKKLAIRDNKMLATYIMTKLIGSLVKLKHINHMTIYGVLYTVGQIASQKVCLQH